MAQLKLDDVFASSMTKPKKLLDLSKTKITCFEEYQKYMDKVPDLKMTPEKVDLSQEKPPDCSFTISKKERQELDLGTSDSYFLYEDAMPVSMRAVRLADLFSVAIHWKMLTDCRPVSKKEEDYFNRMIDLGKFKRDTKLQEAQQLADSMSNIPGSSVQAKALAMGFVVYKSKRGTAETKLKSCKECGLELCTGIYCKLQLYDAYARVILDKDELEAEESGFSLKNVIAQANAPKGVKEVKKVAKPSLTAMIFKAKKKKRKRKKKAGKDNEDPVRAN